MDRSTYKLFCLLGIAPALAISYCFGPKGRAYIPSVLWWTSLGAGALMIVCGLAYTTTPSLAPRITLVGKAYDFVWRQNGDSTLSFSFLSEEGVQPIYLETSITVPGWGHPEVLNGRIFRVAYVQRSVRPLKNEAIDIEILSGRDSGFHHSVDASPAGLWFGNSVRGCIEFLWVCRP